MSELDSEALEELGFNLISTIKVLDGVGEEIPLKDLNLFAWANITGYFAIANKTHLIIDKVENLIKLVDSEDKTYVALNKVEFKDINHLLFSTDESKLLVVSDDVYEVASTSFPTFNESDIAKSATLTSPIISLKPSKTSSSYYYLNEENELFDSKSGSPIESNITSFEISQDSSLILGSSDGSIKTTEDTIPKLEEDDDYIPISITTISKNTLLVLYVFTGDEPEYKTMLIKKSDSGFEFLESFDICPPFSEVQRKPSYYVHQLSKWSSSPSFDNLHLISSSLSSTISIINENIHIAQASDSETAELPLNEETDKDSSALGFILDISGKNGINDDELDLPRIICYLNTGEVLIWSVFCKEEASLPNAKQVALDIYQKAKNGSPSNTTVTAETPAVPSTVSETKNIDNPFASSNPGDNPFASKSSPFGAFSKTSTTNESKNTNTVSVGDGPTDFGRPKDTVTSGFGQSAFGNSGFGQSSFGKSAAFGQSAFGQPPSTNSTAPAPAFGQSAFGQPSKSSAFGQSAFGGQSSFGSALGTSSSLSSGFGKFSGSSNAFTSAGSEESPFAKLGKDKSIFDTDDKSVASPFSKLGNNEKSIGSSTDSPFSKLNNTDKSTDSPFAKLSSSGANAFSGLNTKLQTDSTDSLLGGLSLTEKVEEKEGQTPTETKMPLSTSSGFGGFSNSSDKSDLFSGFSRTLEVSSFSKPVFTSSNVEELSDSDESDDDTNSDEDDTVSVEEEEEEEYDSEVEEEIIEYGAQGETSSEHEIVDTNEGAYEFIDSKVLSDFEDSNKEFLGSSYEDVTREEATSGEESLVISEASESPKVSDEVSVSPFKLGSAFQSSFGRELLPSSEPSLLRQSSEPVTPVQSLNPELTASVATIQPEIELEVAKEEIPVEPVKLASYIRLGKINYPKFNDDVIMGKMEQLVYETDAQMEILLDNLKNLEAFVDDQEIISDVTPFSEGHDWKLTEVDVVDKTIEKEALTSKFKSQDLCRNERDVESLKQELNMLDLKFSKLKSQLSQLEATDVQTAVSRPLTYLQQNLKKRLRTNLHELTKGVSDLEVKLINLKTETRISYAGLPKFRQLEQAIVEVNQVTRNKLAELDSLQSKVKALEKFQENELVIVDETYVDTGLARLRVNESKLRNLSKMSIGERIRTRSSNLATVGWS